MSVTVGASASGSQAQAGDTLTISSFTVSAGTDCLVVLVGAGSSTQANRTISSVTWNGTGLTRLPSAASDDGNFLRADVFYLLAPTPGTGNVVVTIVAGGSNTDMFASITQFSGVDQTTPFGTPVLGSSTSTNTPSVSVSYAAGNVALGIVASDANSSITETGTLIAEAQALSTDTCFGSQYYTGGGTQSVAWSASTPDNGWAVTGVELKAAGGGGSKKRMLAGLLAQRALRV